MRIYEELFVVRPDITEEEIDPIIDHLKSTITTGGGTVDKVEKWGVRKLAYRVGKRNEGYYVLAQFTAGSQVAKEVERRLRMQDAVMKFITVRIDEKLKRLEKRKKQREKRAARKPAPVVMPAAALPASPEGHPAPGAPGAPIPGAPVVATPPTPVTAAEPAVEKES
jgi:small subunit ribosomal protein S6